MKNLFDYATKELSQDAFLRWLFENYNCENKSLRTACRKLFDSFTENKFKNKTITDLVTIAQWKNIDISIWFKIDGIEQLIIIEDKTGNGMHDNQLSRYEEQITKHNEYWKNRKTHNTQRYIDENGNIFKIFYKTNIIDDWEINLIKKDNKQAEKDKWQIYDIYSIYNIFEDINTDNELLGYYIEHIKKIHSAAKTEQPPSKWELISWHSFFNQYKKHNYISEKSEIGCYRNEYYYTNFFVKGHETDFPCFEIRSRDFEFNQSNKTCNIIVRAVLYNLTEQANAESIKKWQQALKKHGFNLNYRTNITKHKQIGTKQIIGFENNIRALTNVFNEISLLLSEIFSINYISKA